MATKGSIKSPVEPESNDFAYWDGASWTGLDVLSTPNFHAVGTQTMAFVPPEDWQQGVPTDITFPVADGFDANLFWVRVRATTLL